MNAGRLQSAVAMSIAVRKTFSNREILLVEVYHQLNWKSLNNTYLNQVNYMCTCTSYLQHALLYPLPSWWILLDMSLNCIGARLVHTRVHVMSNSKQMLHALVAVVCLYSLCLSLSSLCPLPSRLNILLSDSLYKVGNIVRVPFHAT